MALWTKSKFKLHPNGPATNVVDSYRDGVLIGKNVSQPLGTLKISSSKQLSRDTSFKLYKRMLERGELSSLSPEQKHLLRSWDFGSNFTVEHMIREPVAASVSATVDRRFRGTGTVNSFKGPWHIGIPDSTMSSLVRSGKLWPELGEFEDQELFARGGTAIKQTLPTRSTSSLGIALIELMREGVPSLVGSQLRREGLNTRSVGGEYLNYQFGWQPLVSDIVSILDTVRRSADILTEYHRLSGQHIRRRREFDEVKTVDEFYGGTTFTGSCSDSFLYESYGARPHVVRTMTTKDWFSGAYRYHLPYGDDLLSKIRLWEAEANRLMGIRITPELLWNATPWTWLSDWFVSIGDVISNISHIGQDGLTLHYGYIMRTTTVEAEVRLPGVRLKGSPFECSERVKLVRKVRRQASPYGFGITPEALTPLQWSILAALGATRSPGIGFNTNP